MVNDLGIDPTLNDCEIMTIACENETWPIVDFLLSNDKVKNSDKLSNTPPVLCENGCVEYVHRMLRLTKVVPNQNHIVAAIKSGNIDIVKMVSRDGYLSAYEREMIIQIANKYITDEDMINLIKNPAADVSTDDNILCTKYLYNSYAKLSVLKMTSGLSNTIQSVISLDKYRDEVINFLLKLKGK